jgi:hypothetical protein
MRKYGIAYLDKNGVLVLPTPFPDGLRSHSAVLRVEALCDRLQRFGRQCDAPTERLKPLPMSSLGTPCDLTGRGADIVRPRESLTTP